MPDDLKETSFFFEQVLRDFIGGDYAKFKKACYIIDSFKGGDIYLA
jgi:hypothetical protein